MKNVSDKRFMKTQNTHFMFRNVFSDKYEDFSVVQKYGTAGRATDDSIIWRMHISLWPRRATYTFSELAILTAFPRQKWLRVEPQWYFLSTLPVSLLPTTSNAYSTVCVNI